MFAQLAPCDIGRERARINRRAKLFPIMPDGPDMVFMRVGDEDAIDHRTTFFEPRNIRQDQIHTRRRIHIREGHAQIDDNQPFSILGPVAIDIGIHADFAGTPKGQIDQAAHESPLL